MNLDIQHILAYTMMGVGGIGLVGHYGSTLLAATKAGISKLGGSTGTTEVDQDTKDFQALALLHARFDRLKCPEGLAACDTALQHFFHGTAGNS